MTLQLTSITLADTPEQGVPLQLRVLLPPNLPGVAAGHGHIAVKLEAETPTGCQALGALGRGQPVSAEPSVLLALALLESWNDGKLPSLAQLTPDQLRQLLQPLQDTRAVYPINRPHEPYAWAQGIIPEVHPHLNPPPTALTPSPVQRAPRAPDREPSAPSCTPAAVEGSLNFLAVTLPDRAHSGYAKLRNLLESWHFSLEPSNRKWWLRDRHRTLAFLAAHWSELEHDYQARFSEHFRAKTAGLHRARLEAVATPARDGKDAFEVDLALCAPGVDAEMLRLGMEKNQPFVEGHKGPVLLETGTLEALARARRALQANGDRADGPRLRRRIGAAELALADEVLEALGSAFQPPAAWKDRANALRHRRNLPPPPLPAHWKHVLRPYQLLGVAWLWHLRANQLGGILADEMGLGKTLQTLALIESIRSEDNQPALVVCPAALVENWRREALRFAPGLRVFVHHGSGRLEETEAFHAYGLVITSYNTLTRDAALFQTVDFSCIAGDEAQHIKNRDTRNARALRQLHGRFRMLLTGTPIENSVDDLHALFEFIMPGLLQRPDATRGTRAGGESVDPRPRAAPFILRRTKTEVAPELPEKIEQTLFCKMAAKQAAFYHELEKRSQHELLDMESGGAADNQVRFAAFRQLLRLRQACADPRLLEDTCTAEDSAKAQAFGELLEEALDAGRRLLVFSQFTRLLRLIGTDMDARGIPFFYLDGNTRDRTALCQRFNDDPAVPVFLISLRAGGTGLNLTGADTVVHFDPWWNPAVEAQATARAHRIGQTRTVFSYRLIVAGTVEERVLSLQKTKARLLDELLEGDASEGGALGLDTLRELLGV